MIKSGAVIQNFHGVGRPFPSNYNPLGRPGNQDEVRAFDPSKAFDTGFPKDVSPYQPRVAAYTEEIPRSVFRPRKYSKRLALKNGAFMGQTALKAMFGGEENAITDYMAQRLLGIVDGRMSIEMEVSAKDPFLNRQSTRPSTATASMGGTSTTGSSMGTQPMGSPPTPTLPNDLFDLDLGSPPARGSAPLSINTALPSPTGNTDYGVDERYGDDEAGLFTPSPGALPSPTGDTDYSMQSPDEQFFDAVGEVETQPIASARATGMLTQTTDIGSVSIQPKARRGFRLREEGEEGPSLTELENLMNRQVPQRRVTIREPEPPSPVASEASTTFGVPISTLPSHVQKQFETALKGKKILAKASKKKSK
jgi:hypothetical protein